jgi:hypothetical protein
LVGTSCNCPYRALTGKCTPSNRLSILGISHFPKSLFVRTMTSLNHSKYPLWYTRADQRHSVCSHTTPHPKHVDDGEYLTADNLTAMIPLTRRLLGPATANPSILTAILRGVQSAADRTVSLLGRSQCAFWEKVRR